MDGCHVFIKYIFADFLFCKVSTVERTRHGAYKEHREEKKSLLLSFSNDGSLAIKLNDTELIFDE